MPNMSTLFRPSEGPMVIDLRGHEGNYESSPCEPAGCRTFGIWSMTPPREGDLIIKPVTGGKPGQRALYKIKTVRLDFRANEGDNFYKGEMVDVIDSHNRLGVFLLTPADNLALDAVAARDAACSR